MKINKIFSSLVSLLIFTPFFLFAQSPKKANNWYFGQEAGLSFQNGLPVSVNNGAMNSFEGTAVVSDHQGELLFYSNGGPGSPNNYFGGVWNKAHQLMPNGDLSTAGGCNSSLQSSLIVNHPGAPGIHYLFTTDCMENNAQGGLRFSVIDMNLDGGMGDVATAGIAITDSVNESLTAIRHANGEDYWVVAHKLNTDTFHVYHLSARGISGVTTSAIGPVAGPDAGTLKASANGENLVYATSDYTFLFDFNSSNGEITNARDLGIAGYTAEFSPNCRMLYVGNSLDKEIYQFNLIFPNPAISANIIGTTAATGIGAMQLGPDGKIYVTRMMSSSYLSVINDPNRQGTDSDFQDLGLHLGTQQANVGLPNFPNDIVGECRNTINEGDTPVFNGNRYVTITDTALNSINLAWNPNVNNHNNFNVMYRKQGTAQWNQKQVYGNAAKIDGLSPATKYQIRVVADAEIPQSKNYKKLNDFDLSDLIGYNTSENETYPETFASTLSDFEIAVFPNPASQNTSLAISSSNLDELYQVDIFSVEGKRVYSRNNTINNNYEQINLDLSHLPAGIYQISVRSNEISKSQKLVLLK
ncbi:MAG: T9SS type A sorting domain-containing protein [Chitinophagales bacterium]